MLKINKVSTPRWAAERISTARRQARPDLCRKCNAQLLAGDDHDRAAVHVRVDPTPVDPLTEVAALLAGRQSYDLVPGPARGALHHRQPHHHHAPRRWPVLLEHRCP